MGSQETYTIQGGKLVFYYAAQGAIDDKQIRPGAGKKWKVLSLYVERDQSATLDLVYRSGSDEIEVITQIAAGTTNLTFPQDLTGVGDIAAWNAMIATQSVFLFIKFGATQTTPEIGYVVLET